MNNFVGQLEFLIHACWLHVPILQRSLDSTDQILGLLLAVENIILSKDLILLEGLQLDLIWVFDLFDWTTVDILAFALISGGWGSLSFLGSFLGLLLLDGSLALTKFLSDLIGCSDLALHPRVTSQVSEGQTCSWVQLQHVSNHVLELFTEEAWLLVSGVLAPEEVCLTVSKELVMRVVRIGRVEWWVTRIQDEKDDTQGKQINAVALVRLLSDKLRGHVGCGTKDSSKEARTVATLHRCSETKVSKSDVELVVKHDVLRLQVAVTDTLGMHKVHYLEHLGEVVSAGGYAEGLKGHIVE